METLLDLTEKIKTYLQEQWNNIVNPDPITIYGPNYKAPQPAQQPQQTPQPTQQPVKPGFNIQIPSSDTESGMIDVPSSVSQLFGDEMDKYGLATESARRLHHPMEMTLNKAEQSRIKASAIARGVPKEKAAPGPNRGENPEFITGELDRSNPNGSIDRGLNRINSQTYTDMWSMPYWRKKMQENGIRNWDDMKDPTLNTRMAYLRGEMSRMSGQKTSQPWYAAPLKDRY